MASTSDTGQPQDCPQQRIDVIYHNMNVSSDFRTVRNSSDRTLEEIYLEVARHLEAECYRLVSVSVGVGSFVVALSTPLNIEDLAKRGFPSPKLKHRTDQGGPKAAKEFALSQKTGTD